MLAIFALKNQEMSDCCDNKLIVSDFEKDLECPVCFNIPREVPIPACPAGHIVCKTCKPKVQECPTCRREYPWGKFEVTNSLAASLIDKVPHKCKYSDFQCEVKMKLSEIVQHEKICPERTVKCPKLSCGKVVKMREFHEHAIKEKKCAHELTAHGYFQYLSQGYLKWDGVSFRKSDDFDLQAEKQWKLVAIRKFGKIFYHSLVYDASRKCFLFCAFLAEGEDVAANYNVKYVIKNEKYPRKELTYKGQVISIENMNSEEVVQDRWCVHYEAVKHLLVVNNISENNNQVWEVKIPIDVEVTRN